MAQVTYRGVKYDTETRKNSEQHINVLTYRGTKYTKEKVEATV